MGSNFNGEEGLDRTFKSTFGYSILLITLMLLLLAAPILVKFFESPFVLFSIVYLPFFAGIYAVSDHLSKRSLYTVLLLMFGSVAFQMFLTEDSAYWSLILGQFIDIGFYMFLSAVIIYDVLVRAKKINFDMIAGILCVYLLIGLMFADIYVLIQLLDENAFAGVKFIETDPTKWTIGFVYFSFVTLTTLGYGDISPNTIEAGSFVYFEAIIGQIFLTVLVARLVGIHISQSKS